MKAKPLGSSELKNACMSLTTLWGSIEFMLIPKYRETHGPVIRQTLEVAADVLARAVGQGWYAWDEPDSLPEDFVAAIEADLLDTPLTKEDLKIIAQQLIKLYEQGTFQSAKALEVAMNAYYHAVNMTWSTIPNGVQSKTTMMKPVTREDLVGATLALITLKDNLRWGLTPAQGGAAVDVVDHAVEVLGRAAAAAGAPTRVDLPADFLAFFDGVDISEGQLTQEDLKLAAQKLHGLKAFAGDVWGPAEVALEVFYHAAVALWPTLPKD